MSKDIKQLKPSKHSRYQQGYINPRSCKKLFESQRNLPVIFRSSLERKFVLFCENSDSISRWGSECVQVPYVDPRDGSHHTYNPDFLVEKVDGTKIAVEIKPSGQTQRPPYPYKPDYQWNTYIINVAKWDAAKKFFSERGVKFVIVTEKFFV